MPKIQEHSKSICWTAGVAAAVCLLGVACTGGDPGPRQGTPPWFFEAAKDNFAILDYTKTVEQLKEAARAEGDLGMEAGVWRFVLTGGLALGYDEIADAFVKGAEVNDEMIDEFQPSINDYRRRTRVNAIQFAEGIGPIQKLVEGQETVTLNVPLPSGNNSVSPLLSSVAAGNAIDAQLTAMVDQTLTRGIFSALSTLTGGREFSELTQESEAGSIQASVTDLSFGVARLMLDVSVMFDKEGLNDPKIRAHILNLAQDWAAPHLENEELAEKVEEFEFDIENERRDVDGKRRIKKDD